MAEQIGVREAFPCWNLAGTQAGQGFQSYPLGDKSRKQPREVPVDFMGLDWKCPAQTCDHSRCKGGWEM